MAERRACAGTTKAGKPCRAPALKATGYCMVHGPEEVRESKGFGGPQEGAGRPALPKPTELARQLIEKNVIPVLRPHFAALGVTLHDDGTCTYDPTAGAKVLHKEAGEGGTTYATTIDDLAAQIAAAERLLDRVYGKPKQATELSGPGGDAVRVEGGAPDLDLLTPEELRAYLELVKKMRGDGGGA